MDENLLAWYSGHFQGWCHGKRPFVSGGISRRHTTALEYQALAVEAERALRWVVEATPEAILFVQGFACKVNQTPKPLVLTKHVCGNVVVGVERY